jgi:class 3 adenylate cyclase/tetratricopeptide (TPR) repeat protein
MNTESPEAGWAAQSEGLIAGLPGKHVRSLYDIWATRDKALWSTEPKLYGAVAQRLLRAGEPLLAFDVTREAVGLWPQNTELQVLEGLALARCRATGRANALLASLYDAGHRDEETVGILARTYKDLWEEAQDPALKQQYLQRAESLYSESFAGGRDPRYWSGINAATLQLLLGDVESAQRTAREVQACCVRALAAADLRPGDHYWLEATLGEAALVLEQLDAAGAHYAAAVALASNDLGDLASTRRNARLILQARQRDPQLLEKWLPAPVVVVFTGHLIDAPDRPHARFPASSERAVFDLIKHYVGDARVKVGFSSAACGADILFLEAMLELGAEINIVLPSDADSFVQESVLPGGNNHWVERFERVVKAAKQVLLVSQHPATEVYLAYTNVLMFGLAKARARGIEGQMRALAVWDGLPGAGGGTASAIARWRSCGQPVQAINPLTLQCQEYGPVAGPLGPSDQWLSSQADTRPESKRALVSLLFADAVGFSKLAEEQIPQFVTHFLKPIAALLERSRRPPIVQNTWGDALYFVFNDIAAAGVMALEISELISATRWADLGLPPGMGIRIGLHSGPAYPVVDPIIRQSSYTGVSVSRAARIEPITPAGAVYASQEFAALAEAVGVTEFVCQYVGVTPMAKSFGEFPTYQVRRA